MLTIALSWLVLGRMNLNYRSCHIGSIGYLGIDELPPKMVMKLISVYIVSLLHLVYITVDKH